ncbi:MAG TPA: hypothetical protein VNO33_21495 [Kofleriaceae bacterium]|nr:hypothetical protein [Kofleriaceae bacterium]
MRRVFNALVPALLLMGGTAHAQDVLVEGPGIKVGEATVLHPRVGLEAGVVSNVFYEDEGEVAAPIGRLLAGIDIAPAGEDRVGEIGDTGARTIDFRAGTELQYTEYLSSNDRARDQRNLDAEAHANLVFFPQGNVAFGLSDKFERVGRPTNFESTRRLDRDVNHFKAEMIIQPRGHNISGGPRYENKIDYFESDESEFASRIQHILGAKVEWKFFPYTKAWLDGSIGFFDGLGDNNLEGMDYKVSSRPLRVQAGIDTILTEFTTVNAYAGYANGFYESGPSFSSVVGGLDFGWRYLPTGRMTLGYRYDVHDSINSNYYGEHHGKLGFQQGIRTFLLSGGVGARFRGYRGVSPLISAEEDRDDLIIEASFRAAWVLRDRFSVYADYALQVVETDFRTEEMDDPSYMRHEAVLGLIAAF